MTSPNVYRNTVYARMPAPWRKPPLEWREVEPTLEDVFIRLMGEAEAA